MSIVAVVLTLSFRGRGRELHLPGPTSDGHYQIELACDTCHTEAFSNRESLQQACVRCHGTDLAQAQDSHPEKKFRDPRNADRIEAMDARYCVTCHREHRPELISEMGVSLPRDYCFHCHEDIAQDRPSHAGMGFDTCQDAGCHNFHDNRGLYEDFLEKHLHEPAFRPLPRSPKRREAAPVQAAVLADAPAGRRLVGESLNAWEKSAHAAGGIACSRCHETVQRGRFDEKVSDAVCGECHTRERDGFLAGRHGMRVAAGLEPMRVAEARIPMRADAAAKSVGCTSCHGAHAFDTRSAAASACLGCHDDEHSRAFRGSSHERAWLADPSGQSGASCATCHLPRLAAESTTVVEHNQNANLRPNEKMLRGVCLNCHGLGFSLDSLADAELVRKNFKGRPAKVIQSLEMVEKRKK